MGFLIPLHTTEFCKSYSVVPSFWPVSDHLNRSQMRWTYSLYFHTTKICKKILSCTPLMKQYQIILIPARWASSLHCNSRAYLPPKNAMSQMRFDPGTSSIASHRSTNRANGNLQYYGSYNLRYGRAPVTSLHTTEIMYEGIPSHVHTEVWTVFWKQVVFWHLIYLLLNFLENIK